MNVIQDDVPRKRGGALSIVITITSDLAYLRRCLDRLTPQIGARPIEVIAAFDSTVAGIAGLQQHFPDVMFLDLGRLRTRAPIATHSGAHELFDFRAAAGLRTAGGDVVALLRDTAIPDPNWCNEVLKAHRLPHGVIGGAVQNSGQGAFNWALYLVHFARYQSCFPEGPTPVLSDLNVTYKREALMAVKGVWAERYNEMVVHGALADRGVRLWFRPQIVVHDDRGCPSLIAALKQEFAWGRLFGGVRIRSKSFGFRLACILGSPAVPFIRAARTVVSAFGRGTIRLRLLAASPQVVLVTLAWSAGEAVGYVTGRESPRSGPVE